MAVSKGSEDILDDDYDALPSPVCPQPKEKKKLLTRFLQGRAKPEELQAKNILHAPLDVSAKLTAERTNLTQAMKKASLERHLSARPDVDELVSAGILTQEESPAPGTTTQKKRKVKGLLSSLKKLNFRLSSGSGQPVKPNVAVVSEETRVFHISPELLGSRTPILDGVPCFLVDCGQIILADVEEEGIFRMAGSHNRIEAIRKMIDANGTLDLSECQLEVHDAASLIGTFLRSLPEPLLAPTKDHLHKLGELHKNHKPEDPAPIDDLSAYILQLPASHVSLLKWLIGLLHAISQHSPINKMTPENLATCVGSSLVYQEPCEDNVNLTTWLEESKWGTDALGLAIKCFPALVFE